MIYELVTFYKLYQIIRSHKASGMFKGSGFFFMIQNQEHACVIISSFLEMSEILIKVVSEYFYNIIINSIEFRTSAIEKRKS